MFHFLLLLLCLSLQWTTALSMESPNEVLLKVINYCIELDPVKERITPEIRNEMEAFYKRKELLDEIKHIQALSILLSYNLDAYLNACKRKEPVRKRIITQFVRPFLIKSTSPLNDIAATFDEEFRKKTMPVWLSTHGRSSLLVDLDRDDAYLLLCLCCALHHKNILIAGSILASGLCDLSLIKLPPKSAWAENLLAFAQAPHFKQLAAGNNPHLEELIKTFSLHPEYSLASRPDLCTYIANPNKIIRTFAAKSVPDTYSKGQTLLHWACMLGHVKQVKQLVAHNLSRSYINYLDDSDNTALTYAAQIGSKESIELLLHSGAQVTLKDLFAAVDNDHQHLVEILCEKSRGTCKLPSDD
jgi:hypothetical protein